MTRALPLSQRVPPRRTLGNVIEKEPNDDQAHATPFTAPMALNGVIDKPGDVDQFVFKATKGRSSTFDCYARRIRSPLDPVMYLGKKGGGATARAATTRSGPTATSGFKAPEDGRVRDLGDRPLSKGGPDYAYRIEVTPVAPALTLYDHAEQIPLGTGVDRGRRAQGKPAGDPGLGNRADFGGDLQSWASEACRPA